jgi:hypothetical protein
MTSSSSAASQQPSDPRSVLGTHGSDARPCAPEFPRKVKVAVATSFPRCPDAPYGGVEAVSVNLVEALAKCADLEIHVVTMDCACRAPTVEPWRGATVHRLPWTGRNVLTYAIGAGRRQMLAYLNDRARMRATVSRVFTICCVLQQIGPSSWGCQYGAKTPCEPDSATPWLNVARNHGYYSRTVI